MSEALFPSAYARFLVHRRQASRSVDWLILALSLRGTEPYATWTLQHGWFALNDARVGMEARRV